MPETSSSKIDYLENQISKCEFFINKLKNKFDKGCVLFSHERQTEILKKWTDAKSFNESCLDQIIAHADEEYIIQE